MWLSDLNLKISKRLRVTKLPHQEPPNFQAIYPKGLNQND